MKKQSKKVNKKCKNQNQNKKCGPLHNNKKYPKKNKRKEKNNKIVHSDILTQKDNTLTTKQKPLKLFNKSNKIIGTKMKEQFSIKVERYFGPNYIIKNSQTAKQKVRQQISSLDDIIDNFRQRDVFFKDFSTWILSDFDSTNKTQQLNLNQTENFRKVMFHMFEGKFTNLILETNFFSSLIMFSHIKLHNLREITLKNTVISIESLTWFDCPYLKQLTIQNSDVVNIKSLNKCNWKDLSYLRIIQNKIPCANFERIGMRKGSTLQVMGNSSLYRIRNTYSNLQDISVQDIRCLARSKVQLTSFARNNVFCSNRISQLKIIQKFNSKSIIGWGNQMEDQSQDSF